MNPQQIWRRSNRVLSKFGLQLDDVQWWQDIILIAIGYLFLSWLTLTQVPSNPSSGAPFWPAAGFAVAVLLLRGRSRWFGVYLGRFYLHCCALWNPPPWHQSFINAFFPTISALIIASLFLKLSGTNYPLNKVKTVFIFILCAVFTGTVFQGISNNLLTLLYQEYTWTGFGDRVIRYWIGDSIGILFFAPFLLAWGKPSSNLAKAPQQSKIIELIIVSLFLIIVGNLSLIHDLPLTYFFFLPLLWSAFRLGAKTTTFFVVMLGFTASILTGYKSGFFYKVTAELNSILFIQLFIGVICITTMLVLAIVHENQEANNRLKRMNLELEERVIERTKALQTSEAQARLLAQKAEAANHAKSTFIANMSHELRSPLNAVLGFSQLMLRDTTLNRSQYENASIIYHSGEYLLSLINNVLDLSKIEADKIVLSHQNFDLHQLLEDLEDMLFLKAENKGLTLKFEYTNELSRFFIGDSIKLRQVLINLLTNAIKFTYTGSIVLQVNSHSISPQTEELWFSISDTGVGIDAAELPLLFDAFTQTQSGIESQEGTGLGLIISRKFIHLMGGDISVESQLNQGTIFRFNIRLTRGQDIMNAPRQHQQRQVIALAPNQPTYKILTVDDKPINCQLLVKLLTPLGFAVKTASNGQEAIALWAQWHPDLILMDLRMPVMDGYTATKYIKAAETGKKSVIIALTASVLEEEKALVLASGCDDFIRKPFTEEIIFESLNKHLGVTYLYQNPSKVAGKYNKIDSKITQDEKEQIRFKQLQKMPIDWLHQVHTAALEADYNCLMQLMEEIPISNLELAEDLSQLAKQFDFEQIIHCTAPLLPPSAES